MPRGHAKSEQEELTLGAHARVETHFQPAASAFLAPV